MGKILMYLALIGYGHKKARHHAFHKGCETWLLKDFKLGKDGIFWNTEHTVTCSKCSVEYTARRALMVKGKWFEMGRDEKEARAYAKTMNENEN